MNIIGSNFIKNSSVEPASPPDAPTGVTATPVVGAVQVSVSCTPPSGTISSYKWYRATSEGGTYTIIPEITTASGTDNPPLGNTTYWYKVRAVNGAGDGTLSSADSALTVPSAPSDVVGSNSGSDANWQWTPGTVSDQELQFRVVVPATQGPFTEPLDNTTDEWHTDQNTNGYVYSTEDETEARIRASNASGYGPWTNWIPAGPA